MKISILWSAVRCFEETFVSRAIRYLRWPFSSLLGPSREIVT
jgi:hypothetical protein